MSKLSLVAIAIVPALALFTGCSGGSSPPTAVVVPEPTQPIGAFTGTLTLDWTIDGATDPNRCNASVATTLEVHVVNSAGFDAGTFQQACEAFATSITLDVGSYTATALLLDAAGQPRTTAVPINPFTIL